MAVGARGEWSGPPAMTAAANGRRARERRGSGEGGGAAEEKQKHARIREEVEELRRMAQKMKK